MSETRGIPLTLRVLRRSLNPAATQALAVAVAAGEPELQRGAVQALAERPEPEAQTELLRVVAEAPAEARQASHHSNVSKHLRKAVIAAVKSDDTTLAKRACRYAIDANLFSALPAIIEQAALADHPYGVGLATAALRLCREMASQIENRSTGGGAGGADPSFYRTATLQRLNSAAEQFGEHKRLELVEALLQVTTRDNPQLLRLLRTEGHPCHDTLINDLRVSPSFGAMDVLCNAIVDSDAPKRLIAIAAERPDKPFVTRLAEHVGYPIGVRARENTARVSRFAWMQEDHRAAVLELTGDRQATAAELAVSTSATLAERLNFLRFMLGAGNEDGRTAACHLLRGFDSPEVLTLIGDALKDGAASVVAAAARQLRSRGVPGAETVLIGLLEHPEDAVRRAAQDELHELNLAAYRELFERLTEPARRSAGRLVARADPDAPQQLAADLQSPIVRQRLDALAMIDAMGLVDELSGPLATALADADLAVRSESARMLGAATRPSEEVVGALVRASSDTNLAMRTAVEKSLGSLRSLEVAATLIDRLQTEFEAGDLDDEGDLI